MGIIHQYRNTQSIADSLQPPGNRIQLSDTLCDHFDWYAQSESDSNGSQNIFQIGRPNETRGKVELLILDSNPSPYTVQIAFEFHRMDIPFLATPIGHHLKPAPAHLFQKLRATRVRSMNDRKFLRFRTLGEIIGKKPALGDKILVQVSVKIEMVM